MFYKVLRISAFVAAIAIAVGVTFGGRVSALFQGQQAASQTTAAGNARQVIYWYDSMNPQHHYDKPGKAQDGMDLVPQYAEDGSSPSASVTSASTTSDEGKILFWY